MVDPPFQWQVVYADLEPVRGAEQGGRRPVVIVSREAVNVALPIVAVLPLTRRKPGRRVYATEALLPPDAAGQPSESIVMAHQVRTVAKERLLRTYGWLDDEELRKAVRAAMQAYLDLE